jgi:hypothetical protein
LVRSIWAALIVAGLAVLLDSLVPLALDAMANGMPADPVAAALETSAATPLDIAAARYGLYAVALWLLGSAWRDMTRSYHSAPLAHD